MASPADQIKPRRAAMERTSTERPVHLSRHSQTVPTKRHNAHYGKKRCRKRKHDNTNIQDETDYTGKQSLSSYTMGRFRHL